MGLTDTPVPALLLAMAVIPAAAQKSKEAEDKLKLGFESRGRYERRTGQAFGRDPDLDTGLYRHRLSLTFRPVSWLKLSGMVQDSRAPWYGPGAPNTVRDPVDLQEGYVELFPNRKNGFGMAAGRRMMNYGEGRLIGSPQWGNLARTFDHARVYWRSSKAHFEVLLVSPVKIRIGEFNRPALSDRTWGFYNVFTGLPGRTDLDVYLLRHLRVNTFGARFNGPLTRAAKFSLEGAVQPGNGAAWVSWVSRRWMLHRKPFDLLGEYKYASGAFDQMYAANHDKFGHMDLFGWRNLHNARSLATLGLSQNVAFHCMYDSWWLASARDALYNGAGRSVARSASGGAGRHVGQEIDWFLTYKYKRFTLGAGLGHVFQGEFLRKATPGVSPRYAYLFHSYSF